MKLGIRGRSGSSVCNASEIFCSDFSFQSPEPKKKRRNKEFTMYVAYFEARCIHKKCDFRITVEWV